MSTNAEYKKELGRKIRDLRIQKGMSQEELAKKVGYKSTNSRSTINKIEMGKNDISQSKIPLYAKALGVSVGELLATDKESKLCQEVHVIECIQNTFGDEAWELMKNFLQLNAEGKKKAVENLEDLTAIEKYLMKEGE